MRPLCFPRELALWSVNNMLSSVFIFMSRYGTCNYTKAKLLQSVVFWVDWLVINSKLFFSSEWNFVLKLKTRFFSYFPFDTFLIFYNISWYTPYYLHNYRSFVHLSFLIVTFLIPVHTLRESFAGYTFYKYFREFEVVQGDGWFSVVRHVWW